MSHDIHVLNDFLPADAYEALARFISQEPMLYGSRSNYKTDPHGHWSQAFIEAGRHNTADIASLLQDNPSFAPLVSTWQFLRDQHLHGTVLLRCYLNGYTYGTDGYFHVDSHRADEQTTIFFINDHWEPDWGGETTFLDDDGDIIKAVLPRKNRAIIFPSTLLHVGRGVSRKCMTLRRTLIFKSRRRRSANYEKLSNFLQQSGATRLPHKSGSLHDHLMRTFSGLEAGGHDDSVCFGGGLHAIYGTNSFKVSLLTRSAKSSVVNEFGSHAERLADYFSMIDRPGTLESPLELDDVQAVVALRSKDTLALPRKVFDELRTMECANLADQNSLSKYPMLKRCWNT